MNKLDYVKSLVSKVSADLMGLVEIKFRVRRDCKHPKNGRIFIQCVYNAPCTITKQVKEWRGRKWYLSDYMTEDEVVKTCYGAFEMCVKHELMEGFKFEGNRVFNPHTPFRVLMEACKTEQYRK